MQRLTRFFITYYLEWWRNRSATFFMIIFPGVLYFLFGARVKSNELIYFTIVFLNYAVQTVVLQGVGMSVAFAKNTHWRSYLHTLPAFPLRHLAARLGVAIAYSCLGLMSVVGIAFGVFHLSLHCKQLLWVLLVALLGGVPFAFLGIALGHLIDAATSRTVFVLLNITLLFGSFNIPSYGFLQTLKILIPTYQWAELSYSYFYHFNPVMPLSMLVVFTLMFYIFAHWAIGRKK